MFVDLYARVVFPYGCVWNGKFKRLYIGTHNHPYGVWSFFDINHLINVTLIISVQMILREKIDNFVEGSSSKSLLL